MRQNLTINGQKSVMNSPKPVLAIYRVEWCFSGRTVYQDVVGLDNAKDIIARFLPLPSVSCLTLFVRLSGTWVERPLPILS